MAAFDALFSSQNKTAHIDHRIYKDKRKVEIATEVFHASSERH